ncbi:MAG: hypothetical protein IJT87_12685 [Ruminiclostridium sp.]|nr:hypothetical protein [Ruminiclostridium sp.]
MIVFPVFMIMTFAVAQTLYISSVNSYLKAQDKQIADMMNGSQLYIPLVNNAIYKDDNIRKQIFDVMEELPIYDNETLTDEEAEAVLPYLPEQELFWDGRFNEIPEDIRALIVRDLLGGQRKNLNPQP